jgi:hypothetical protein
MYFIIQDSHVNADESTRVWAIVTMTILNGVSMADEQNGNFDHTSTDDLSDIEGDNDDDNASFINVNDEDIDNPHATFSAILKQNDKRDDYRSRVKPYNSNQVSTCHGIYGSIVAEPRGWPDILGRLREEHAKIIKMTPLKSQLNKEGSTGDTSCPSDKMDTSLQAMQTAQETQDNAPCYNYTNNPDTHNNCQLSSSTTTSRSSKQHPVSAMTVNTATNKNVTDKSQSTASSQANGTGKPRSLIPRQSLKKSLSYQKKARLTSI